MKWSCNECGNVHGMNPDECQECGHTVLMQFRPDGEDAPIYTPASEGVDAGGGWVGFLFMLFLLATLVGGGWWAFTSLL